MKIFIFALACGGEKKETEKKLPDNDSVISKEVENTQNNYEKNSEKIETDYEENSEKIETRASEEVIEEIKSKFQIAMDSRRFRMSFSPAGNDVGVIPNNASCPSYAQEIMFFMDDEDGNNYNSKYGWTGAITQQPDSKYSTRFKFCRVDGSLFKNHRYKAYAVLRLGVYLPTGGQLIERFFDNEDSHNANTYLPSGFIAPNIQSKMISIKKN